MKRIKAWWCRRAVGHRKTWSPNDHCYVCGRCDQMLDRKYGYSSIKISGFDR